jgi:hypothetical protein
MQVLRRTGGVVWRGKRIEGEKKCAFEQEECAMDTKW